MALTSCCGCFDLKKGTKAIAITMIVLSVISLVLTIGLRIYQAETGHRDKHSAFEVGKYFGMFIQIVSICFSVMLIHAVKRACRSMVQGWLNFHGFVFGLQTLGTIALFGLGVILSSHDRASLLLPLAMVWGITNGIQWYFFAVVVAYRKTLDDGTAGVEYEKHENDSEAPQPSTIKA